MSDSHPTVALQEEKSAPDSGDSIIAELKELQGEHAQLTELEEMERDYAEKLINALKEVQSGIDEVIPLEKTALGPAYRYAKEAYLGKEAVVILMNNTGISTALPLSKFKSPEILSIVQSATPPVKKGISLKRKPTAVRGEIRG